MGIASLGSQGGPALSWTLQGNGVDQACPCTWTLETRGTSGSLLLLSRSPPPGQASTAPAGSLPPARTDPLGSSFPTWFVSCFYQRIHTICSDHFPQQDMKAEVDTATW